MRIVVYQKWHRFEILNTHKIPCPKTFGYLKVFVKVLPRRKRALFIIKHPNGLILMNESTHKDFSNSVLETSCHVDLYLVNIIQVWRVWGCLR